WERMGFGRRQHAAPACGPAHQIPLPVVWSFSAPPTCNRANCLPTVPGGPNVPVNDDRRRETMTAALWRIVGVLLLGLVPLLSGCQPIQAPPDVAVTSTADIVRGDYGQWDLALIPSYALAEDESVELAGYANPEAMVTSG